MSIIMAQKLYTKIIGTGSYIPEQVVKNEYFSDYKFFDPVTNTLLEKSNEEIIQKFQEITNINERRWVRDDQVNSDIAAEAIKDACKAANIELDELDFMIIGHNFGDVAKGKTHTDILPSLANKVKGKLGLKNPACICHDVVSGCPGWTQGMVIADAYIRSETFKIGVVVGSDVLSRISEPHDRDTMIFADGAGATVVKGVWSDEPTGILSQASRSDSIPYANLLQLGGSFNPEHNEDDLFMKMAGHKLYVYALKYVPGVVKDSIEKASLQLSDIKKVLIHQANEKMDEAILKGVFKLYKEKDIPEGIMPMSISELGNSSTATVPTLLDLIIKGKMENQEINEGDYIVLCSVGAGMNINSIVYKW